MRPTLTHHSSSQAIRAHASAASAASAHLHTPQGIAMTPSQLNPTHESFVIVQSDDEGIREPALTRPNVSSKPTRSDHFTFVGGVYPSLASANEAALALAAKECNCSIPDVTFSPLETESTSRASSISSASAFPNLAPAVVESRPQLIHQKSADGRYLCRCKSIEASREGEEKAVKLEVRKIELRPLGSRMGWSFSDDDA